MSKSEAEPINNLEIVSRRLRVDRLAAEFGFTGQVEYRHEYSNSGGAQYVSGSLLKEDVLIVYVEAFERHEDAADFSLEAMIAHERGHQVVHRYPQVAHLVGRPLSLEVEEVLSSVVGAVVAGRAGYVAAKESLILKAWFDMIQCKVSRQQAPLVVRELYLVLEKLL